MTGPSYTPTDEQERIINHPHTAFVRACPGAGKTRTMVERARRLLNDADDRRGIAFLSFTTAAVGELESRLRALGVLPAPMFPSFIGTFDTFLWQFFIAPFGMKDCGSAPRLIPEKGEWKVIPFEDAQPISLSCFNRLTGKYDDVKARAAGEQFRGRSISAHETCARKLIERSRKNGQVDFEDIRSCVQDRLADKPFADCLGAALAGRFREIIVDEAQDCNAADLAIVDWLRQSGVAVKVICDPNQSIYGFRGGVTDELEGFAQSFDSLDRLSMSGNFRSSPAICAAVTALRPPAFRGSPDVPLGRYKSDMTPIYIFSYGGSGVCPEIGSTFRNLVQSLDLPLSSAPVLASTRASAAKAIGQPTLGRTKHMTLLLAEAVMNYQFSFAAGGRREALVRLHQIVLLIQGRIDTLGDYHTYLHDAGIQDLSWRPAILELAKELRSNGAETAEDWLNRARSVMKPGLTCSGSINQRLKMAQELSTVLVEAPIDSPPARTIHSVKGKEFQAVCLVMTTQSAAGILDLLQGLSSNGYEEDLRKIYVGASRAERLLAIAIPKGQASRLEGHFSAAGCATLLTQI